MSSHQLGVLKPARAIYEAALERLNVQANAVVFLDDVEAYVQAARDVGMRAYCVSGVQGAHDYGVTTLSAATGNWPCFDSPLHHHCV